MTGQDRKLNLASCHTRDATGHCIPEITQITRMHAEANTCTRPEQSISARCTAHTQPQTSSPVGCQAVP